jgi:hypothetical protein
MIAVGVVTFEKHEQAGHLSIPSCSANPSHQVTLKRLCCNSVGPADNGGTAGGGDLSHPQLHVVNTDLAPIARGSRIPGCATNDAHNSERPSAVAEREWSGVRICSSTNSSQWPPEFRGRTFPSEFPFRSETCNTAVSTRVIRYSVDFDID